MNNNSSWRPSWSEYSHEERFAWLEVSRSDTHTSAQSVGPSEDPALLDLSERREHDPDVVLVALLRHHADEQLPVFHRCRAKKKKKKKTDSVNGGEDSFNM